jgi:hypothetical protein
MPDEVMIVCGPESFFLDDVKVNCADCGCEVFHRPHTPQGICICLPCLVMRSADPQFHGSLRITKETAREIAEEIRMRTTKH